MVTLFSTLIHNWLTVREPLARAQLRWMTFGIGLGLAVPFTFFLIFALRGLERFEGDQLLWLMLLVPISLAIAITRYRLFDIDVIIRRTLVYSLLSATLALIYLSSVVVLQRLLAPLVGESN